MIHLLVYIGLFSYLLGAVIVVEVLSAAAVRKRMLLAVVAVVIVVAAAAAMAMAMVQEHFRTPQHCPHFGAQCPCFAGTTLLTTLAKINVLNVFNILGAYHRCLPPQQSLPYFICSACTTQRTLLATVRGVGSLQPGHVCH
jgi:hypothetical protein